MKTTKSIMSGKDRRDLLAVWSQLSAYVAGRLETSRDCQLILERGVRNVSTPPSLAAFASTRGFTMVIEIDGGAKPLAQIVEERSCRMTSRKRKTRIVESAHRVRRKP